MSVSLSNADQLLIRACCGEFDSLKRLKSTFRRFYTPIASDVEVERALAVIMAKLVDRFNPMPASQLMQELDPRNHILLNITESDSFDAQCIKVFISRVRKIDKSTLHGVRTPLRFKNISMRNRDLLNAAADENLSAQALPEDRYPEMHKLNFEIAKKATLAVDIEWGEEEQIDAENSAFQLCIDLGVFTQDQAEFSCLKATTEEMMDWIESKVKKFNEQQ